jgi:hypothetical protein
MHGRRVRGRHPRIVAPYSAVVRGGRKSCSRWRSRRRHDARLTAAFRRQLAAGTLTAGAALGRAVRCGREQNGTDYPVSVCRSRRQRSPHFSTAPHH